MPFKNTLDSEWSGQIRTQGLTSDTMKEYIKAKGEIFYKDVMQDDSQTQTFKADVDTAFTKKPTLGG